MPNFILTWLLTAIALLITAYFVPGFNVSGIGAAAFAAIVLGLVNAVVRPILIVLTLPLTILTLGLFLLVVNAISIGLVGFLSPGVQVEGFFPALFASIVLTLVASVLNLFFRKD